MLNTSPFATTIMCHVAVKYLMFSAGMKSLVPFVPLMRKPCVQVRNQRKKTEIKDK